MGSLISKPKTPPMTSPAIYTIPAPVYMPPPAPSAAVTVSPVGSESPTPVVSDEDRQTQTRAAGLLERRRGVMSTVLTGFRGLLGETSAAPRKTLLGE